MAVQCETSEKGSDANINVETVAPCNTKSTKWFKTCSPQYLLLITMLGAAIMASLVTLTVLLTRFTPIHSTAITTNNKTIKHVYSKDPGLMFAEPKELKIVTKKEWLAQPPQKPPSPLRLPVPYVIIMHTGTENCSDISACSFHVRYVQSFHIDSRGWWDIGYNWLVGGDGYVYEGRGWMSQGANIYGYNANSIGIAFIGTFNQILPPAKQIDAAKRLIEIGVEKGYIAKDYKLLAARELQTTQNPGLLFYENLRNWPHWSPEP